MMGLSEELPNNNPEDGIDPDKIQFNELCKQLSKVYTFATLQKNMRFKNKIVQMIDLMKKKDLLLELFSALAHRKTKIG